MYYKMETDGLKLTAYIEKQSGPTIFNLTMGTTYNPKAGKLPFRFTFRDPHRNPLLDYIAGKCLMSKAMIEAMEGAGVDNLQKFEAELTDESSGAVNKAYYVVNIVGLVAAAELSESDSLPLGGGHVFTDLTIDPKKAQGLLMFRLAESLVDVIVHERIANAIKAGNFRGVVLTPVSKDED